MAKAELTRAYITVELVDGTVHEDIRILFKDRAAYMKSARINNWDKADQLLGQTFMVWHAGKRNELWTATFEDFQDNQLVDMDAAEIPVSQDDEERQDPTPAS